MIVGNLIIYRRSLKVEIYAKAYPEVHHGRVSRTEWNANGTYDLITEYTAPKLFHGYTEEQWDAIKEEHE